MAKAFPKWFAAFALSEARKGDPAPLIAHLQNVLRFDDELSDDEIAFIVEALEATAGKRGADNLRKIEKMLITEQIEGYVCEGMPQKRAIETVMNERKRSRRHIFGAMKVSRHN